MCTFERLGINLKFTLWIKFKIAIKAHNLFQCVFPTLITDFSWVFAGFFIITILIWSWRIFWKLLQLGLDFLNLIFRVFIFNLVQMFIHPDLFHSSLIVLLYFLKLTAFVMEWDIKSHVFWFLRLLFIRLQYLNLAFFLYLRTFCLLEITLVRGGFGQLCGVRCLQVVKVLVWEFLLFQDIWLKFFK